MTITLSGEVLVWISFFVLLLIHGAIAFMPLLTKKPRDSIGGVAVLHAIITMLYAALYPVWFPQGIAS